MIDQSRVAFAARGLELSPELARISVDLRTSSRLAGPAARPSADDLGVTLAMMVGLSGEALVLARLAPALGRSTRDLIDLARGEPTLAEDNGVITLVRSDAVDLDRLMKDDRARWSTLLLDAQPWADGRRSPLATARLFLSGGTSDDWEAAAGVLLQHCGPDSLLRFDEAEHGLSALIDAITNLPHVDGALQARLFAERAVARAELGRRDEAQADAGGAYRLAMRTGAATPHGVERTAT